MAERWVTARDGVRLWATEHGIGHTVVIPGAALLEDDLDPLFQEFHVILYDIRNRGRSDPVPLTGELLDQAKDFTSMAIAPSAEASKEQAHPAVITHPVTKRKALYVNPIYTTRFEGWNQAESQALLDHIYRHSTNENFTCRFRWERHTLAIWDNRCTMHNALNDYSGVRREMFRTSVRGSSPRA